jgi:hypothetical protein
VLQNTLQLPLALASSQRQEHELHVISRDGRARQELCKAGVLQADHVGSGARTPAALSTKLRRETIGRKTPAYRDCSGGKTWAFRYARNQLPTLHHVRDAWCETPGQSPEIGVPRALCSEALQPPCKRGRTARTWSACQIIIPCLLYAALKRSNCKRTIRGRKTSMIPLVRCAVA